MVTISMVSYPPESAVEITKRFFKLSPMPDFVTVVGPYTITELEGGIQAITIYKYDKAKARSQRSHCQCSYGFLWCCRI